MRRTFLFRSSAGVDHYMIEDENGTRFEAIAATDPVIERNKAMRNHNDGYTADRSMRRVASIPYIVGIKWLNEEGWWFMDPEHADKLAAKLNSSDWAHLRTADGHLGVSNGIMR
jgi:hypothetical protein